MNFPHNVDELIHWDTFKEQDSFGSFTVITGFEGTGRCFWCGADIKGRRRFCKHGSGCWTRYQEHFAWSYASARCLKRYDYRCANCGEKGTGLYIGDKMINLRIHHIIPLNGQDRTVSVYNIFWNLICLCHNCHMKLHAVMRQSKELLAKPDFWELAKEKGQFIFEGMPLWKLK